MTMTQEAHIEVSNTEARDKFIRAGAAFAYQIARAIKSEDGEKAAALAMALADDPNAEFVASVRLAPTRAVVLCVTVGGKPYIIDHEELLEDPGIRH